MHTATTRHVMKTAAKASNDHVETTRRWHDPPLSSDIPTLYDFSFSFNLNMCKATLGSCTGGDRCPSSLGLRLPALYTLVRTVHHSRVGLKLGAL